MEVRLCISFILGHSRPQMEVHFRLFRSKGVFRIFRSSVLNLPRAWGPHGYFRSSGEERFSSHNTCHPPQVGTYSLISVRSSSSYFYFLNSSPCGLSTCIFFGSYLNRTLCSSPHSSTWILAIWPTQLKMIEGRTPGVDTYSVIYS